MPLKIVRNDITQMQTEAIVNTANTMPIVGPGCDRAIYDAAGYEELLAYRKEKIGNVPEGEVFLTPGFGLKAKYIIHAVSPLYLGGGDGEEEKLRSCYQKSLRLAKEKGIGSIAFPLISTGSFGYPKEEGMRIAVDEINAFLLGNEMEISLVVFDDRSVALGKKLFPDLEDYIRRSLAPVIAGVQRSEFLCGAAAPSAAAAVPASPRRKKNGLRLFQMQKESACPDAAEEICEEAVCDSLSDEAPFDIEEHESKLEERIRHLSDTFSQYLMYLIEQKHMENADVYKRAIVDKKIFSKIKNNETYHPQKLTALCLCIGAKLNMDETRDLLARAGYALSPCDKTDIIFSYFIEHQIYDMIELDIQLEEHGLPCIIS